MKPLLLQFTFLSKLLLDLDQIGSSHDSNFDELRATHLSTFLHFTLSSWHLWTDLAQLLEEAESGRISLLHVQGFLSLSLSTQKLDDLRSRTLRGTVRVPSTSKSAIVLSLAMMMPIRIVALGQHWAEHNSDTSAMTSRARPAFGSSGNRYAVITNDSELSSSDSETGASQPDGCNTVAKRAKRDGEARAI